MTPGRLFLGLALLGVLIHGGTQKGSWFNPGRYKPGSYNGANFIVSGATGATPYAGFFGAGSSTLEEEIMPYAGFFGAGSSKLEEPLIPGAGFLSMSSPIQEEFYGPNAYVPWEERG